MSLFPQYVAYEGSEQPSVSTSAGILSSLTGLFGGALRPQYTAYAPADQISTNGADDKKLLKK